VADEHAVLDTSALARLARLGGESLVARMIAIFLDNAPHRVAAATRAAATGDVTGVERAAHSLKSMAANVGAHRLRDAAELLETGIVTGNGGDLAARTAVLQHELDVVRMALESRKGGSA
jgi:two-component system sensor histidine kinase BarA